mgnify:CR=1 FL=1
MKPLDKERIADEAEREVRRNLREAARSLRLRIKVEIGGVVELDDDGRGGWVQAWVYVEVPR